MDFVEAVVAGAIAAGVWALIVLQYYVLVPWHRLRRLRGTYRVTRKHAPERIECEALTVDVRLRTRTLTAKCARFGKDHNSGAFEATVIMSRDLLSYGRGHYTHLKCLADRPMTLFGFIELQVGEDKNLLVHHTFADPADHALFAGFVREQM